MKTITATNRKGGTAKTATCFVLGCGLIKRGYKVLFVDLDSQCNLTYDVMGDNTSKKNALTMLLKQTTAKDSIQHTETGFDIIPGTFTLSGADILLTGKNKEYRLKEVLAPVSKDYDFCIVDTPPQLSVLVVEALTASDGVIIPSESEIHSLQGLGLINSTIQEVRKHSNLNLHILGILLTRYNRRTTISKNMSEIIEDMSCKMGTELFKTRIRNCVAVTEAETMQTSLFDYAPRSNASKDYNSFIDEVLERL